MLYKKFFTYLLPLIVSLGVLLLFLKTPLAGIYYQNPVAHSFLMLVFTTALFFVWFFSYQYYVNDRDTKWYIIVLTCFILAFFYSAHAVLVPSFDWGNEALFDISEHYGLFLVSLVLWGLVIPFSDKFKEKIYLARNKILLVLFSLLFAGFASLFFLPHFTEALFQLVNVFISLTGISFFILSLVLLTRKEQNFFTTLFPIMLAFGVAISIMPFFYKEWNLIWWINHLLLLTGALLLLLKMGEEKKVLELPFSSFSIRTKLFLMIGLMLVAIVGNDLINFNLSQNHLKSQTVDNLVLMADLQEGQVLGWLEKIKGRAVGFASDGFINNSLKKILSGDQRAVVDLNRHLLENKLPVDQEIFGIYVMDVNGKVVASSHNKETGKEDMAMEEVFLQAKTARAGVAYLSDIVEDAHFGEKNIAIMATAPIIDQAGQKNIGVIMLFFRAEGLLNILTGKAQGELGALSSWITRKKTLEMYLVNHDDKLMLSKSKFIVNTPLRQKVDTVPVRLCAKSEEMSGEYLDYRQIPVFGASMCFTNGWVLLVEIDKDEVLASLGDYLQQDLIFGFASFLLILIAMYLFSIGIITPLKELSLVAQKLGKGDFMTRITLVTHDEFGELAQVFNSMADSIQKGKTSLEEKVKEVEASQLAISHILEDLAEEKKNSQNFANDLEKFKLAVDGASDQIIITNTDGVVIYINKAVERITGYKSEEVVGKKSGALWKTPMPQAYYKKLWDVIKKQKGTFIDEVQNKRKSGEIYTATISISPVLDKNKNILFFVGIERDITKEKEVDKAKTEFVSLASHQLRTPLTAINWYAEMILSGDAGKITSDQKKYLDEIYMGNKRMVDLVNSLLNVSRLELGTLTIEPQPTNMMELAQSVIDEQKQTIDEKKIHLKSSLADDLPIIQADPKLLRMVIQNLLSNAVKYTPEEGNVELSLALDNEKKNILMRVSDTGYGIPKLQQDKIFTKLFRANNVREKDTEGTGLGLYIVKSIIEHSGGKVWFESEENKGTTFYVTLPFEGMKKKEGTKQLS